MGGTVDHRCPAVPGARAPRYWQLRSVDATFVELGRSEGAPIAGGDLQLAEGRARKDRPSGRYSERLAERGVWPAPELKAAAMLEPCRSGGEVLRLGLHPSYPEILVATEGYRRRKDRRG